MMIFGLTMVQKLKRAEDCGYADVVYNVEISGVANDADEDQVCKLNVADLVYDHVPPLFRLLTYPTNLCFFV